MADEPLSLQIDNDWKKQAQEEKRKLAEQSATKNSPLATAPAAEPVASSAASAPRRGRVTPAPGFGSLVQSVMTQIFYYLGELSASTGQPSVDLDLAKHHLDTLAMLEDKTKNNLTADEQSILDAALYETRTRFVNVASQMLGP